MNFKFKCAVLILIALCNSVENASILALFSSLSFPDHSVFRGYVSLLAQRGHSIVVMTPYPGHFGLPEAERIVELNVGPESSPYWEEYKNLLTDTNDYYPRMRPINEIRVKIAVAQLNSKQMTALFENPHVKFDLVITEAEVPILYAAAEKYQAPHIAISTTSGAVHQYESKGAPTHPTLYPDVNALYYRNMSQWQKFVEINRHIQTKKEYYNNYLPLSDIAARKIFDTKKDLMTVEKEIDMLFIANNPVLIGNRPSSPAIAYVDRLHIKPGFPLSVELKNILDSATKGAIYFSLGTIQESEHLSVEILQTLADAFKELPYTILWKIGNTTMFNKPDNVIASVWFPQQEVLAHPNVKAFITNGGSRSLEEAIFYEVPIVGLPVVRSRKVFIEEITRHGAGEILDLNYLEKEHVKEVLTTIATSDGYKNAIIKLKHQITDPIISGPEKAVLWTEYILRNGGARNLRSPAVGVSFVQYFSLDVISILLTFFSFFLLLVYVTLRYMIRRARIWIRSRYDLTGKFKAL